MLCLCSYLYNVFLFLLMIRRPPRFTRPDTSFPTRRSSDLRAPGGAASPLVMVGPVAVRPDVQNDGHGRALMAQMLTAAETGADGALMMIGDPDYYGRFFAFTAAATGAWDLPGPFETHRLLARAANGHALPIGAGMIGPR